MDGGKNKVCLQKEPTKRVLSFAAGDWNQGKSWQCSACCRFRFASALLEPSLPFHSVCFVRLFVRFCVSFLIFLAFLAVGQEYRQAIWPRIEKVLGHKLLVGKPRAASGAHHNGDPIYWRTSLPLGCKRVSHNFPASEAHPMSSLAPILIAMRA